MTREQKHENKLLLIHGFTGGPYEVEPLGEFLAKHGYKVRIPTLPGHESHLRDLGKVNWKMWVEAMEREAERFVSTSGAFDLIGFSMGGMIAAHLAARYPVRRLVLLNASVIYVSPVRFMRHITQHILEGSLTELYGEKRIPLAAALQFMQLAKHLRADIEQVKAPTLVIQSGSDQVVHPNSARYLLKHLGGPTESRIFPKSKHMICLDVEAEEVFRTVARFLQKDG